MPARRAFTWVELLVVLVIFAVLFGLLLPLFGRLRLAAARAQCQNNLKQISLATVNCADSHQGVIPPGAAPDTHFPPDERLSVHVLILPYCASVKAYPLLNLAEPWDSDHNVAVLARCRLESYHCPSSATTGERHLATTGYVGVAGLGANAPTLPAADPRVGMFGYDLRLKLDQVKDGLASTAMFVETTRDPGPWARGGPSTVRGIDPADRPVTGPGRPFGGLHMLTRSHPWDDWRGGSNVGLADGSVRYLRDDADPAILTALATAAGGEPVPADW